MRDTKPNLSNAKFEQLTGETLTLSGRTEIHGFFEIENGGVLRLDDGNQGAGKVMTSDSTGGTSWQDPQLTGAAAPDTSVQFNNGGEFSGSSNFTWDNSGRQLDIVGDLAISGTSFLSAGDNSISSIQLGQNACATGVTGSIAIGNSTCAYNDYSLAIGSSTDAIGDKAVSIGYQAVSSNNCSLAFGAQTTASGSRAIAMGVNTQATGTYSATFGRQAVADSTFALAMGDNAVACAGSAIAIGRLAKGEGGNAVSIGINSCAGASGVAIGNAAKAYGTDSAIAIGLSTISSGDCSTVLGHNSKAIGATSIAIGQLTTATANDTIAIGRGADALTQFTVAIGCGSYADGNAGVAVGRLSNAGGGFSTALGNQAQALGTSSIALGGGYALNGGDMAFGSNANAIGSNSLAILFNSSATGTCSTAIGIGADALNTASIAIGSNSNAGGVSSIVIGNCATDNNGACDIVIGVFAKGYGSFATAVGRAACACNISSAFGASAKALGGCSVAVGIAAQTYADAGSGVAIGCGAIVSGGSNSVAIGWNSCVDGGASAIALGAGTHTTANNSTAIGVGTNADATNTIALGVNVENSCTNSLAVGWTPSPAFFINNDGPSYLIGNETEDAVKFGLATTGATARLHIVATGLTEGFRLEDGSESNNLVLTSDASGYGTWKSVGSIGGSGITGSTNGLTDNGQDVCLGGTLTTDTQICLDTNAFSITGSGVEDVGFGRYYLGVTPANDLATFQVSACDTLNLIQIHDSDQQASNLYLRKGTNCGGAFTLSSSSGATITGLNFDYGVTDAIIVQDDFDNKGLVYNADYSSNWTDRSIPDKAYVDSIASGLDAKDAVVLATTASDGNIDISGGTFSGGSTIDGIVVQDTWRVLIKNQTDAVENGIYDYSASTSGFTRSSDFDGTPSGEVSNGAFMSVVTGDTLINTQWILTTADPITIGVSELTFSLLSQQLGITAGDGIDISTVGSNQEISTRLKSGGGLAFDTGEMYVLGVENVSKEINQASH